MYHCCTSYSPCLTFAFFFFFFFFFFFLSRFLVAEFLQVVTEDNHQLAEHLREAQPFLNHLVAVASAEQGPPYVRSLCIGVLVNISDDLLLMKFLRGAHGFLSTMVSHSPLALASNIVTECKDIVAKDAEEARSSKDDGGTKPMADKAAAAAGAPKKSRSSHPSESPVDPWDAPFEQWRQQALATQVALEVLSNIAALDESAVMPEVNDGKQDVPHLDLIVSSGIPAKVVSLFSQQLDDEKTNMLRSVLPADEVEAVRRVLDMIRLRAFACANNLAMVVDPQSFGDMSAIWNNSCSHISDLMPRCMQKDELAIEEASLVAQYVASLLRAGASVQVSKPQVETVIKIVRESTPPSIRIQGIGIIGCIAQMPDWHKLNFVSFYYLLSSFLLSLLYLSFFLSFFLSESFSMMTKHNLVNSEKWHLKFLKNT
jgi:hypothetical protein